MWRRLQFQYFKEETKPIILKLYRALLKNAKAFERNFDPIAGGIIYKDTKLLFKE